MSQTDTISQMTDRLQWLAARQQVLTQNIANVDTPGYRAMDVAQQSFKQTLSKLQPVTLATTNPAHIAGMQTSSSAARPVINHTPLEVLPTGNTVNLEDETRKATQNVIDYQLMTNIYRNENGMVMKALGK